MNKQKKVATSSIARKQSIRRFWVSWVQPTEDYRPIQHPPNDSVLGWWCSGYNNNGNATLVALIEADNEQSAEGVIKKDWPEWNEWRFIEERSNDWRPGDRFPLSDWMKPRIS